MSFDQILLLVPVLLFSIVAHEYAHAEAAYRQGDATAYMLGRLTLNPLKHIDPFLTIILLDRSSRQSDTSYLIRRRIRRSWLRSEVTCWHAACRPAAAVG